MESGIDGRVHANDVRAQAAVCGAGADRSRTVLGQVGAADATWWREHRGPIDPRGDLQHAASRQRAVHRVPRRLARRGGLGGCRCRVAVVQEAGHALVPQSQAGRDLYA